MRQLSILVQCRDFRAPLLALLFVSYEVFKIGTFLAYKCDRKISVANQFSTTPEVT